MFGITYSTIFQYMFCCPAAWSHTEFGVTALFPVETPNATDVSTVVSISFGSLVVLISSPLYLGAVCLLINMKEGSTGGGAVERRLLLQFGIIFAIFPTSMVFFGLASAYYVGYLTGLTQAVNF